MSNKYYYLVSSLPFLKFEDYTSFNRDIFLEECRKWLSESDLKALFNVDVNELEIADLNLAVLKKWKNFDLLLKEELAIVRKAKKTAVKGRIPALISSVYSNENPLQMEIRLAKLKWDFIDGLEFGFYFDINFLILYYLKLQILERLKAFDQKKGFKTFENLCEVKYE